MLGNPHQRAARQQVEEQNQVRVSQMDAAVRIGPADAFLITRAVDVNVAVMRVHAAALVESRLQPREPQDARGDFGIRKFRLRRVADDLA